MEPDDTTTGVTDLDDAPSTTTAPASEEAALVPFPLISGPLPDVEFEVYLPNRVTGGISTVSARAKQLRSYEYKALDDALMLDPTFEDIADGTGQRGPDGVLALRRKLTKVLKELRGCEGLDEADATNLEKIKAFLLNQADGELAYELWLVYGRATRVPGATFLILAGPGARAGGDAGGARRSAAGGGASA
jgi:hypothetical protein